MQKMKLSEIDQRYFNWLYKLIGKQKLVYRKLCQEIHAKKFRWFIPNDDNRCEDGLNLRDEFLQEGFIIASEAAIDKFLKRDCTVLEVLVALSQRIEFLMDDLNPKQNHTSKWFSEMLINLRLNDFTDTHTEIDEFYPTDVVKIDQILENLISRTYDYYGNGSLFPMKRRPPKDMSKVEIWYQLMLYLDENYVM